MSQQQQENKAPSWRSPPAGISSTRLNNHPTGKFAAEPNISTPRGASAGAIAGRSSVSINTPRPGKGAGECSTASGSAPNSARAATTTTDASSSSAPNTARATVVIAGKSSSNLNMPKTGRAHANNTTNAVVRANAVIKGTAPVPTDNAFVHFHVKRKLLPNSKDRVMVPVEPIAVPVKSRQTGPAVNDSSAPRPAGAVAEAIGRRSMSAGAAPSSSRSSGGASNNNHFLLIGGKALDEPGAEARHKKYVASPRRKVSSPKKIVEQKSEMGAIVVASGGGATAAAASDAVAPSPVAAGRARSASPAAGALHTGKRLFRHGLPEPDSADNSAVRFTKPPYWDEQARPPKNAKYALPTKGFKAPSVISSEDIMSPLRRSVRMKNESVIAECFPHTSSGRGTPATGNSSRRSSSAGVAGTRAPLQRSGTAPTASVVPVSGTIITSSRQPHLVNHDGHRTKGFDEAIGRKHTYPKQPYEYQVYAPTLANNKTNCFRIHPLADHRGKNMIGCERKNRQNPALEFGGNFEHQSCRCSDHPVGRPVSAVDKAQKLMGGALLQKGAAATAASTGRASSAPAPLRRSATAASPVRTSLITSPFDRSCNPGKLDITFESRTGCRPQKEYVPPARNKTVRPVLTKK